MARWLRPVLQVVVPLCLLALVYEGFLVIERAGQPLWLVAFLAVIVPICIGKTVDRHWHKLR